MATERTGLDVKHKWEAELRAEHGDEWMQQNAARLELEWHFVIEPMFLSDALIEAEFEGEEE